jgi:hypothetical protein
MHPAIIIVSGLPRSGTSLMMQMLDNGGVPVVTDNIRVADTDNPRGYYEFERVKKIKQDASWLSATRGKAVKMVSQLLYDLPAEENYRIIFMERDLDEILASQEKMLLRLGRPAAPRDQMKLSFTLHLDKLNLWLVEQQHLKVLRVRHHDLIQRPDAEADRVDQFLGGNINVERMAGTVDPSLYRNRRTLSEG